MTSLGQCSTWTVVVQAQGSGETARAALGELIRRYERTVLMLVRMKRSRWDMPAEDCAQQFFEGVIRRGDIAKLDRSRGAHFRAWLNVAVSNFMSNQRASSTTQRGGNLVTDALPFQAAHSVTPEQICMRQYAEETVLEALRRHRAAAKDKQRFDLWARVLPGPQLDITEIAELAAAFGISENHVSVEMYRLRQKHRRILSEVVADTVYIDPDDPNEGGAAAAIAQETALLYRLLREVPRVHVVMENA